MDPIFYNFSPVMNMSLPNLKANVPPEEIAVLHGRFTAAGYNEAAIAQRLELPDISLLNVKQIPRFRWRCEQEPDKLSTLILLFLLRRGVTRRALSEAIGRDSVSTLLMCGILHRDAGLYSSTVALFPCLGQYFFTDHWVLTEGWHETGHVYEIGQDSYSLARLTPRNRRNRSLDLCTGSGVHAIGSAAAGLTSTAIDINPRALQYTQFNAILNSVSVKALESDLYQAVGEKTYDLITVNPPFVPSPDRTILVHRSPGESGEEVSERLVAGLPKHLASRGLFSMILDYPKLQKESYLDRLQRWLGQDRGWLVCVLDLKDMTLGEYIQEHISPVDDYQSEFQSYLESYARLGIESMALGQVFILRTDDQRPNHLVQRRTICPNICRRENILDWLEAQWEYSDPDWTPDPEWKPNLSTYFKTVWRDRDQTKGILEPRKDNWIPGEELNSMQADLMARLRGQQSVDELMEQWLNDGHGRAEFKQTLRELGLLFAVQ
jgi:methylase of polypeptide subunit release factors